MKKKPTTVIVFASGLGGNHVANLISMAPGVQPRFIDPPNPRPYPSQMLKKYCAFHFQADFDRFDNGNPLLLKQHSQSVLDHPGQFIFCCHIRRLYELLNKRSVDTYIDYIDIKQIIIINREHSNEFAHDRWRWKMTELWYFWTTRPDAQDQTPEELQRDYLALQGGPRFDPYDKATYSRENVLAVIDLAGYKLSGDVEIVEWDPDEIFTDLGDKYIVRRAQEDLGLFIPPLSILVHELWIIGLRKLIDRFKNGGEWRPEQPN